VDPADTLRPTAGILVTVKRPGAFDTVDAGEQPDLSREPGVEFGGQYRTYRVRDFVDWLVTAGH
jgi:hypothetical protein